jgi:hypothetical protein
LAWHAETSNAIKTVCCGEDNENCADEHLPAECSEMCAIVSDASPSSI